MEVMAELPLTLNGSGKIHLKVTPREIHYSFHYSKDDNTWNLLKDQVDAKFLSTKTAGGFVGCIYGMYATSSGEHYQRRIF